MNSLRYSVRTDVPMQLREHGFVAYVHDAKHRDDPEDGASVSWHSSVEDAERVMGALNYCNTTYRTRAIRSRQLDDCDTAYRTQTIRRLVSDV